jgi:hypothetical protein
MVISFQLQGGVNRKITAQAGLGKNERLYSKNKKRKKGRGHGSGGSVPASKCEALTSKS